ncbi:hypothetical protein NHJ6243_007559 [Beauveria neobassiana]
MRIDNKRRQESSSNIINLINLIVSLTIDLSIAGSSNAPILLPLSSQFMHNTPVPHNKLVIYQDHPPHDCGTSFTNPVSTPSGHQPARRRLFRDPAALTPARPELVLASLYVAGFSPLLASSFISRHSWPLGFPRRHARPQFQPISRLAFILSLVIGALPPNTAPAASPSAASTPTLHSSNPTTFLALSPPAARSR